MQWELELTLEWEMEKDRAGRGLWGNWELELTCRRGAVFACGFLLCLINFIRFSISRVRCALFCCCCCCWLLVVNLFTVLYDKSKSKIILFVVAFGIT